MSDLNPDWSKLTQPHLFFGLGEEYTLEELKKAYKSFIKVFKPDIYPEEFKKIRKAYEELQQKLENIQYEKIIANAEAKESEELKNAPQAVSAFNNYEFADINSVNEHLLSLPLSPRTCLYWASFSDVASSGHSHFYWLIKGVQYLENHDYYYGSFIGQFVRSCKADASWLELLPELITNVKAPIFYHFLFPIFNQMIKDLNPEKVVQCLYLCEKKLIYKGEYIEQKQGLYLTLLGKVILTEKPELYLPLVEFLENYKSRMPDDQYNSLEFHQHLIEYVKEKKEFLSRHDLCKKLDELILTYIDLDEEKCRKLILEIKAYFRTQIKYDSHFHSEEFNKFGIPTYKVIKYIFEDIDHILIYKEFDDKFKIKSNNGFNQIVKNTFARNGFYALSLPFLLFVNNYYFLTYVISFLGTLIMYSIFDLYEFFDLSHALLGLIFIYIIHLFFKNKIGRYLNNLLMRLEEKIFKNKVLPKLFDFIMKKEVLLQHISLLPEIIKEESELKKSQKIYERILQEKFYFIHELFVRI